MPTFSVVMKSLLSRATQRPPFPRNRRARLPRPGTHRALSSAAGDDGLAPGHAFAGQLDARCRIRPGARREAVQGERIIDAVGFSRRHRHPRHDELDPVAFRVDHENLPVEVEKHIEGGVAWLRRGI